MNRLPVHLVAMAIALLALAGCQQPGPASPHKAGPVDCPHLVIMLDGVPYSLVRQMQSEGRFGLFPPASRTISTFPAMSDLAFNALLHTSPSAGFEARYFDRAANNVVGGTTNYLNMVNSPWVWRLDYRVNAFRDADAYLNPDALFEHELAAISRLADSARGPGSVIAYVVSTAGLGTGGGEKAIRDYLARVDRLAERIFADRRGRVTMTILADHGHNLVPGKRVVFNDYLKCKGWRPAKSLRSDKDVVIPDYGLVNVAAVFTRSSAGVAVDLACHPAVDLAIYPQHDGSIVVLKSAGQPDGQLQRAVVRRSASPGREAYSYQPEVGDPLAVQPILDRLRSAGHIEPDGMIDEHVLFAATARHEYPDPLRRVWRAFSTEMVLNPADVLLSLNEQYHYGSPLFDFLEDRKSTHGSLRLMSSETFVLTTHRRLPPLVRQEEILPRLGINWANGE